MYPAPPVTKMSTRALLSVEGECILLFLFHHPKVRRRGRVRPQKSGGIMAHSCAPKWFMPRIHWILGARLCVQQRAKSMPLLGRGIQHIHARKVGTVFP